MAFFTHNNDPEDRYREGIPTHPDEASARFLASKTEGGDVAKIEMADEDELPTPSQGSVEQVGVRRSAAREVASKRIDKMLNPERVDNSWKNHRDTPYRPEP